MAPLETIIAGRHVPAFQASFMTGLSPRKHEYRRQRLAIRDNGSRCCGGQSNRLVEGEKVWEPESGAILRLRLCQYVWWYNMASSHDLVPTPRPIYQSGRAQACPIVTPCRQLTGSPDPSALGPFSTVFHSGGRHERSHRRGGCGRD